MTERDWQGCGDPRAMLAFLKDKAGARKLRLFACACVRRVWHFLLEGLQTAVRVSERHADGLATDEELARTEAAVWHTFEEGERAWRGPGQRLGSWSPSTADCAAWATVRDEEDYFVSAARQAVQAIREATEREVGEHCVKVCPDWLERGQYLFWVEREVSGALLGYEAATNAGDAPHEAALCRAFAAALSERIESSDSCAVLEAPQVAEEIEERHQSDLLRDLFGNPWRPCLLDPTWLAWNDGCVVRVARGVYDEGRFGILPVLADALEEAGCGDAGVLGHLRGPGPHARGCFVLDGLLGKE